MREHNFAERDPRAFDALLAAAMRWQEPTERAEMPGFPPLADCEPSALGSTAGASPDALYPNQRGLGLQELLQRSDGELARCDIAELNLACAEGLPGSERIDRPCCLRTLDEWAGRIRQRTSRPVFERHPEHWNHSWAVFRVHMLISVLQRECGVRYNPAKIPLEAALDTEDMFLHGVIQGNGGTCGTLPVVYAAVGRRLGYPLKLVAARARGYGHLLIRWDEPGGERFNVEVYNGSLDCPPDDYYRSEPYQTSPGWEASGSILKSMTPREELAVFLSQRAARWGDVGQRRRGAEALAWARALDPGNVFHDAFLKRALNEWNDELEALKPPGFPPVELFYSSRRYPRALPWELERDLCGLSVVEFLLKDPMNARRWWEPMRRGLPVPKRLAAFKVTCSPSGYDIREVYANN